MSRRLVVALSCLAAFASVPASTALAAASGEGAVAAVKAFYLHPEADERELSRFTGPALETMKRAAAGPEGEESCIGFSYVFDGQDYDEDAVAKSLKLSEEKTGADGAVVTADFSNFDEGQEVVWTMKRVAGAWKVADVTSPSGEWTLGELCR